MTKGHKCNTLLRDIRSRFSITTYKNKTTFYIFYIKNKFNELHAVSRRQQSRQKKRSVKTLSSLISQYNNVKMGEVGKELARRDACKLSNLPFR